MPYQSSHHAHKMLCDHDQKNFLFHFRTDLPVPPLRMVLLCAPFATLLTRVHACELVNFVKTYPFYVCISVVCQAEVEMVKAKRMEADSEGRLVTIGKGRPHLSKIQTVVHVPCGKRW